MLAHFGGSFEITLLNQPLLAILYLNRPFQGDQRRDIAISILGKQVLVFTLSSSSGRRNPRPQRPRPVNPQQRQQGRQQQQREEDEETVVEF